MRLKNASANFYFIYIYPIYRAKRLSKLHVREDAVICFDVLPFPLLT